MITVDSFVPIQCCVPNQIFNPPISKFANLDFHTAEWQSLLLSLQSIDWVVTLKSTSCSSCFNFFIDILYHNCMNHVALLIKIKQTICDRHLKQKLNEESRAVAKIKSDQNYLFRYAKKIAFVIKILVPS